MTPLLPAPPPAAAPGAASPGRESAPRNADHGGFALVLEQEQAAIRAPSGAAGDRELPEDDGAPAQDTAAPAMLHADPATLPLQPAPPWPPGGLAGLVLSAGDVPGDAEPAPLASGSSAPPPGLSPQPASGGVEPPQPPPRLTLASVPPVPEPGPALPADTQSPTGPDAAPAEPADWTPPAFPLPAAATPVRGNIPILAAPAPAPAPDVRSGDFGERFGAQLQWMAEQKIGHARIRVSPQELGPVEVMLRLDGDRISADFISSHAETRQALEQGLPRLRDLLGEQGFHLAHADVGGESSSPGGEATAQPGGDDRTAAEQPDAGAPEPAARRAVRGLVDAYA